MEQRTKKIARIIEKNLYQTIKEKDNNEEFLIEEEIPEDINQPQPKM